MGKSIVFFYLFFQLASSLDPVEVKSGSALSIVNASLVVKDNKYILEVTFLLTLYILENR